MNKKLDIIKKFKNFTNSEILYEQNETSPYLTDWRGVFKGKALFIIFPQNTSEVSKIVNLASELNIPIVPQGGNTGLCGGATPDTKGNAIVVNLKKLNRIRSIDIIGNSINVEAGCILENIHTESDKYSRTFPINLASKGSCTIGGNLATNAGGSNVLKYGSTRDLVLGIEAVLPNGKVINNLTALHKDNTGYALHKLLVGAEGTLGIITAATIKIFPKPKATNTVFMQIKNINKALDVLQYLQSITGNDIEAFEIMSKPILDIIHKQFPNLHKPFPITPNLIALVEFATTSEVDIKINDKGETLFNSKVQDIMSKALDLELIENAVISQSINQSKELWDIRENANIAQTQEGFQIKLDVSIPLKNMSIFWKTTEIFLKKEYPKIKICAFGHLGDGNIHYNLMGESGNDQNFISKKVILQKIVYDNIAKLDGSFSAEHGVGQLKLKELQKYKDKPSLELMKAIKKAFDPKNLFNPGKIFTIN